MRNIKYLVVFVVGLLALSSCDQNDTEGVLYHAKNSEASFAATSSSYTFGEFDHDKYEVTVKRGNAHGAVSLPVTVGDATGIFAVSDASFADGAYEAPVTITFDRSKLTPGENYKVTLTLPDNPINERAVSHTVTIMRDYVWKEHVTGTFKSEFFEEEWKLVMEKAEGAEAYRLANVYADGFHIAFLVEEDGAVNPLVSINSSGLYPFTTGYVHSAYGSVTLQVDADPNYTYFDAANKVVCINGAFTVSAGSFGWYDEIFVW